jgi:(R,R)-butanediol dehydrogenase / meso-butanediol dehydrogenase / diacetyl reductase
MASINQLRIHGVDDLRLDSISPPQCGENDVVVDVQQCGICGTDLGYLTMGGITAPDVPMPIGHELWGVVSQAGSGVSHVDIGDKVVVQPMSNGVNIGNGGLEGGFTPQLLVRDAALDSGSLYVLPEDLPESFGALVEPLAVATHGANRVAVSTDDRAVIYGAGPIGLSMLLVLKYRGLENIVVVDLSEKRLGVARDMGARVIRGDDPGLSNKLIEAHGAESFFGMPMPASTVIFEATGVRAVFEGIVNSAGPGSRICLTGVHKEPATVDLVSLLAKEVSIIPAMGYEDEFDQVFGMLRSGVVDPGILVTHEFPLGEIHEAFSVARDTEQAIKVMIDCQS